MYTVELIPTEKYNAQQVTNEAEAFLLGCVGVVDADPDKAIILAENALANRDEVDVYYTLQAVKLEEL